MTHPAIGPRQSACRVRHPQRGEGLAVHRNGASFFLPDGGEPIPMRVGWVGASAGPPARSWMTLHDPVHGHVQADEVKEPREGDPPNEAHARAWSPLFGAGWLVSRGFAYRFEADAGTVVALDVRQWALGTPDYAERSRRSRKSIPTTDEEAQWTTLGTRDGSTLAFRAAPPGEFPQPNHNPAPVKGKPKRGDEQGKLPGVK